MSRHLFFLFAICILSFTTCARSPQSTTFVSVLSGEVKLVKSEQAALEKMLTDLHLKPEELRVSGSYNFDLLQNGVAIEKEHVVGLALHKLGVKDLSFVRGLVHLSIVSVSQNQIVSLTGVAALTELTYLDVSENGLQDLSGLTGLANLVTLNLSGNGLKTLAGLPPLQNLATLLVTKNGLQDLHSLSDQMELRTLDVGMNALRTATGWEKFPKLAWLGLRENQLTEFVVTQKHETLLNLDLEKNGLKRVLGLENLPNLERLSVSDNHLQELAGTETSPRLVELRFDGNAFAKDYKIKAHESSEWGKSHADKSKLFSFNGVKQKELPQDVCEQTSGGSEWMASSSCSTDFAIVNDTHGQCDGAMGTLHGCVVRGIPARGGDGAARVKSLQVSVGKGRVRVTIYQGSHEENVSGIVEPGKDLELTGPMRKVWRGVGKSSYYIVFEALDGEAKDVEYELQY